jgi:hypothetical protein
MALLLSGNTGVGAEVEASALRACLKPLDHGLRGSFKANVASGNIGAAALSNATLLSFRNPTAGVVCCLRRVVLDAYSQGTGFTAGIGGAFLFAARSWSTADSGGTAVVQAYHSYKFRQTFGYSLVEMRFGTAALTPGTRTVDSQALASATFGVTTGTWTRFMVDKPDIPENGCLLWEAKPGLMPALFAQNEGFIVNFTVPATGVWTFHCSFEWEEYASYVP